MISLSRISNAAGSVQKFLRFLGLPIAIDTISAELEKHPDYPSLLAVSEVLSAIKIENVAFRLSFDELHRLPCPFLAYMQAEEGELLVVSEIKGENFIVSNEKWDKHKLSQETFRKAYAGIVLSAEVPESARTEAKLPAKTNATGIYLTAFLLLSLLIILLIQGRNFAIFDWRLMLLAVFKTAGLLTAILLLIQSIDNNNPLVQKLCIRSEKTNCNAILTSNASRITAGLSWSEVGFYYFASTWLMLCFGNRSPQGVLLLSVLNIISLPYTFYSVYYQWRVAKQWCILCCTVQALLWLEFVPLSAFFHLKYLQNVPGWGSIIGTAAACLLGPVILWRILKPLVAKLQQLQPLRNQLRKFKFNAGIFNQLLSVQPRHAQPEEDWSMVIGDPAAPHVVTLVSNTYCPPCGQAHNLLHDLISANPQVQGRIIFTSENTDGDISTPVTRHLMALSALPDKETAEKGLQDWYSQQKRDYAAWAKLYPVELKESEFYKLDKQNEWCRSAEIYATPTLFINGHRLPEMYYLPDLKYMLQ